MDVSAFAVKLLVLFFPGLICAYIVDILTVHKPRDLAFFLLGSYVFGMASYFIYWVIVRTTEIISHAPSAKITFLQSLNMGDIPFPLKEIALTTLIAIFLGILLTITFNHKLHFRLMQWLRITRKFGEQDVWEFTFNSKQINWVTVRDLKHNLVYDGWYEAFSDNSTDAELLLRDVSVYKNDTGEPLYQVGALYVARDRGDMTLEFRDIPVSEDVLWKPKKEEKRSIWQISKLRELLKK